jgi:hypothetical protein
MSPDDSRPECVEKRASHMAMATVIALVGCRYRYTASGGFWGANPRAPVGG